MALNRKKQILAPYVEGLIKQLTGFEENDKHFHEKANLVYSNILRHNFATVDITTVQRSIQGIAEKLKLRGYNQRGNRLLELVDKYVSSDSSHHTQLNVQWHVLLLLLKLSYNPTSVSDDALKAIQTIPEVEDPQDNINWPEYLHEGWEKFQCASTGSDEDKLWLSSSDEDEGIDESMSCRHLVQVSRSDIGQKYETMGYGTVPHPSLWWLHAPSPPRQEALRRLIRETNHSENWLRNNVQSVWWSGASRKTVPESVHFPAHMNEIWENTVMSKHGRDSSQLFQIQVLSEFKVLHEVLWMLQVPSNTSLFQLDDDDQFLVKANVSLPSTIPDTLRLVMENLCPYFNMINKFKRFEEELSEQEMSENPPPMTYKAYCAALFQLLHDFKKLVVDIETRHNQQEETMTILSVIEELTPKLNIVQYLYNIHSRAVTEWHTQPPWLCATRLLSVLYEALLETSDQMYLETCLNIFIHSFHVYLDIIDVWLSEGQLEDWRKEFLVIREEDNLEVMPYEEKMRACGVTPVSLLSKLVSVVRDAGHTMEVVSQLNKLTELRETVLNKGCLFKEFSENVYNEINRLKENIQVGSSVDRNSMNNSVFSSNTDINLKNYTNKNTLKHEEPECHTSTVDLSEETSPLEYKVVRNLGDVERELQGSLSQPDYLLCFSSKAMNDQVMKTLVDNPLLTEALRGYVYIREPTSSYPKTSTTLHFESADSVPLVGLMSMHSVLEKQLELVITRHRIASSLVTQTLRSDYSLLQHFTVLRTVFFMEAGNLAQSFYSYLFKEIESGTWNDMLNLSVQLQMCVEEFYPGFGNYFSVLVSGRDLTVDVHQAIPSISLAYRVDWPVSLVITQDTIVSYNKVFRFLLHLKYAFWTLHNIRFSDLCGSPNTLVVRRLHVLKLWMYHSTNTLHAYFMGLVLRSFSTHLEESIQLADCIDVIIQAHNKFLDEVKKHCLQDKKTYVETFIMKLLRLCSSLSDHWRMEAAGTLTTSDLSALENQYMIAYRGLTHCLDVVTSDSQIDDFLSELKNEFSYSEPSSPSS